MVVNNICKASCCYTGSFRSSEGHPLVLAGCSETMHWSQKHFALAVVSVGWPAHDNISSCHVQRVLELRALISCVVKVCFKGYSSLFLEGTEERSHSIELSYPVYHLWAQPFSQNGFSRCSTVLNYKIRFGRQFSAFGKVWVGTGVWKWLEDKLLRLIHT